MLKKNVRYAHVSQVLILCYRKMFATLTCHRAKKWKNIAKGSFYQKMYENIICSFLNSEYFIFPEFSCIFQHYKMAAVAATILGPAAKRYGRF
ncbi:hypothetical protein WDU94_013842 [Cyamophila willieti]